MSAAYRDKKGFTKLSFTTDVKKKTMKKLNQIAKYANCSKTKIINYLIDEYYLRLKCTDLDFKEQVKNDM